MDRRYNLENERDLEEVLNILYSTEDDDATITDEFDECQELEFVLVPPNDGEDSDKDDAGSDSEGQPATVADLGKKVLGQTAEVRLVKSDGLVEDATSLSTQQQNPCCAKSQSRSQVRKKRHWVEGRLDSSQKFESSRDPTPDIIEHLRTSNSTPVDLFRTVFDDELVEILTRETVKYAAQKGHNIQISPDDIYKYIAILLLSGYCKVMHRRMYWETRPDTNNALISNSISRNAFDKIHRFFHVNDNDNIKKEDKVYKVRPLISHLNKKFQDLIVPLGSNFSLDEAMEPYYGHHFMKQFIRGKPIRYGFKLWCLATSNGYLIKFEPYVGASQRDPQKTLGHSVVEKLCVGYIPQNTTLYIDNYFNSLPLLESLSSNGIKCIGTLRNDRLEKAPMPDIKKEPRGTTRVLSDKENSITLVRWNDNSQVTLGTNVQDVGVLGESTCLRWNRESRKKVSIPQPSLVQEYNRHMGGVDLFDNLRSLYRIRIRSKKWYWPLIRFCLNGAVVNMWILYRQLNNNISLLEFTRRIVLSILTSPNIEKPRGVRPRYLSQVQEDIRYDNTGHMIDEQSTQRRCGQCGKCTKFHCVKCNVGLHPKRCFILYHRR